MSARPNICWLNVCHPNFCWPNVCWPNVCWPNVSWPNACEPFVCWPNVCWPNVCWPNARWPTVCWPNVCRPTVCRPNVCWLNVLQRKDMQLLFVLYQIKICVYFKQRAIGPRLNQAYLMFRSWPKVINFLCNFILQFWWIRYSVYAISS